MKIDYFILQLMLIEFLKVFLPAFMVFIVMKVKHRKFINKVSKSVNQERVFRETDYSDYIQNI